MSDMLKIKLNRTQRDAPFTELENMMYNVLVKIQKQCYSDVRYADVFSSLTIAETNAALQMYNEQLARREKNFPNA